MLATKRLADVPTKMNLRNLSHKGDKAGKPVDPAWL